MESLNQDMAAINSWCLKWHMNLNPKKPRFMVVSRFRTIAPGYGDLTFCDAELEELESLCIFGVTLHSKLTFRLICQKLWQGQPGVWGSCAEEQESYLIVRVCSRTFSVHMRYPPWSTVLPWGCHRCSLIWVCWIVLFIVRKDCVRLSFVVWGIEGVGVICLLHKIYHRVDHHMNEYLNRFVAARNITTSATLGELALVIPWCKTDQFSQSFLPAAVRLWNILPSGVFSGDTLHSFKSAVNVCLLSA